MSELLAITIVEDRTASSRCDQGFLTLERLRLRNDYRDGSSSPVYDCDLVSRRGIDAVVAVLYALEVEGLGEAGSASPARRTRAAARAPVGVQVLLRESVRPPVYLRRRKHFVHPDPRPYATLLELVAGIVEPDDPSGPAGLSRRAAIESHEEAGLAVPPADFAVLGGETFASPGIGDEKLYYCCAPAELQTARAGSGDGSVMEQFGRLHVLPLDEAIAACRDGRIPDMKTEVGLLRLAEHLGYIPQLGVFASALPAAWRSRYRALGLEPAARRDAASDTAAAQAHRKSRP